MQCEYSVLFYQCDSLNLSSCNAAINLHLHNKIKPLFTNQINQTELGIKSKDKFLATLVPKFAGSSPAEAVGFLERKNPQHAFFRRGSKAVCPMS